MNPEILLEIACTPMPFGKYKGSLLIDLPEPYIIWFHKKGFSASHLGELFHTLYEIKVNGLEHLIKPLKNT